MFSLPRARAVRAAARPLSCPGHAFALLSSSSSQASSSNRPRKRSQRPESGPEGPAASLLAIKQLVAKPTGRSRRNENGRFSAFRNVVHGALQQAIRDMMAKTRKGNKDLDGGKIWADGIKFTQVIHKFIDQADRGQSDKATNRLFWSLRHAFVLKGLEGLRNELMYAFDTFRLRSEFSPDVVAIQKAEADMRFPFAWYPATRGVRRTVHLHVGPTNSGKTYMALKALESAKTGIYAGPLRLLAHEIYERMLAKGKPCALLTGEEQRLPNTDRYYISCTVEMTPLNRLVDVAVIDEIQMMGDEQRGSAWTSALLGVMAKELHLCGEERTVELVQSLCRSMGDECIVHRYERLSPLQTERRAVGRDFSALRKGDAIVTFSRLSIHALKMAIEKETGRRCAIVYGSLPPETRAQQAALFNDPENDYDFLVASDAIGMGLNLEVKRVIFESVVKRAGQIHRDLTVPEVKQIGGRAGRFKSARQATLESSPNGAAQHKASDRQGRAETTGLVTCMSPEDLPSIQKAFASTPRMMDKCYLAPPAGVIERFAACFPPGTPLKFIMLRLRDFATMSRRFEFSIKDADLAMAELSEDFKMPLNDRLTFIAAPASIRDRATRDVVRALARRVSDMSDGHLLNIREIRLEVLDEPLAHGPQQQAEYLRRLEMLHKHISLYTWLTYRFPHVLTSQALSLHVRDLVEERLNVELGRLSVSVESIERNRKQRRREAKMAQELGRNLGLEDEELLEAGAVAEGMVDWNEAGHEEPLVDEPSELDKLVSSDATPEGKTETTTETKG